MTHNIFTVIFLLFSRACLRILLQNVHMGRKRSKLNKCAKAEKKIMNKCAMNEKMLKQKLECVRIQSERERPDWKIKKVLCKSREKYLQMDIKWESLKNQKQRRSLINEYFSDGRRHIKYERRAAYT